MCLVQAVVCTECGRSVPEDGGPFACPRHGTSAPLDVTYDETRLGAAHRSGANDDEGTLWRFADVLPTGPERVRLGAGGTPLVAATSLATEDVDVLLKDETGNPTGSVKARAAAVLVSRAAAAAGPVSCASTGNQAAAVAAYAARAGLDCRVFLPAAVAGGKAAPPRRHGADVYAIEGAFADAAAVCEQVSAEREWTDCTPGVDPFGLEGLRTLGLELGTALGQAGPDWVVVPMGNGTTIAAVWKGLRECADHGLLESPPRLLGVQAAGTAPIHAEAAGASPSADGTVADCIDVAAPHHAQRALAAIEHSDGATVAVPDAAMLAARDDVGAAEGIAVEPASAATVAGLRQARRAGTIGPDATAVCVLTGGEHSGDESMSTEAGRLERVPADPGAIP